MTPAVIRARITLDAASAAVARDAERTDAIRRNWGWPDRPKQETAMTDTEKLIVSNLLLAIDRQRVANLPHRGTLADIERERPMRELERQRADEGLAAAVAAARVLVS